MREINAPSNKSANPWLLVCAVIGAFMAAYVVYDLTSSASDADALAAAKVKASSRERELQGQVDHLKKALEDSDGKIKKTKKTHPVTKISYEEFGHIGDCYRYIITMAFANEYQD